MNFRNILRLSLLSLFIVFSSSAAWAAKRATLTEDATIHTKPSPSSRVVESLSEGDKILIGSKRHRGFIRAKSRSGKIGWIKESALSTSSASGGKKTSSSKSASSSEKSIRFFGGMTMFSLTDISTMLAPDGSLSIANGLHFGLMGAFPLVSKLNLLVRAEYIMKSLSATDTDTEQDYQYSVASLPVMAGLEWEVVKGDQFTLALDGLGGMGLLTKFSLTAASFTSDNVTSISATPLTFLFLLSALYRPSKKSSWILVGEAGYRMLKTSNLTPTAAATNGGSLFTQAVPISLSGLVFSVGAGISF